MIAATQGLLHGDDNTILADFSRCKLFRNGMELDVDFEQLLNGGDISDNVTLQDGDLIFLPPRSLTRAENVGFVSIMGAVVNPGAIPLGNGDKILDVFIKSGGVEKSANWKKAYLKRGEEYYSVNLNAILNKKDMTTNIEVKDGDFIYVPENRDKIAIIGAVSKSGRYLVEDGDRILDMIAKAGGLLFRPNFSGEVLANLKASYIFRDGKVLDVNFQDLLQGGVMKYNIFVEANDFIYIPEATLSQVYIFGEVGLPQAIPLTREISLIDVLARAGDLTVTGKFTAQAAIFRGGVLDKRNVIIKDLDKLFKGDLSENIILQDGDIVYIPEVKISKFARFTGFLTTWMEFITDIYDFQGSVRTGKSRF